MILGIDFSLTSTGVCAIKDGDAECVTIGSKREDAWHEFPNRVEQIALDIFNWVGDDGLGAGLVIESPAFAAKGSAVDSMFGGWWLAVRAFGRLGWDPPLRVTPSQLKKFATGKGNAGKDEVLLAVARRYPDVVIKNNNEADAVVLAAIGAAAYGEPFNRALTAAQQAVVEAVSSRREVE